MQTTTINFFKVKAGGSKRVFCPVCGVVVRRQRVFLQTLNPFNKNAKGIPKTIPEIRADLVMQIAAWKLEPEFCTRHKAETHR